jgi:adenine-specific DNA-methyltransferase
METKNLTEKNIEKIAELFPNVITEMRDVNGKLKKGINFELLKQELSEDVIDGEECYDFTWVGKKVAIVAANTPIKKTLRPCIEESKNWENTENLYIEGDNLDILKLLQESYLNSVKMIYIDPPYNTGNDFIYKDSFKIDKEEYEEQIGLYDENYNMMFKNTDTNGRFHSDWCSMMYPRLKLAYNLLSEDGVIFISIDDNEVENLKKICNELFGESNFIANLIWKSKSGGANDSRFFAVDHEYIIVYAKNKSLFSLKKDKEATVTTLYNRKDEIGEYSLDRLDKQSIRYSKALDYPITGPDGKLYYPKHKDPRHPNATWRWSKEKVKSNYDELVFENGNVYTKNYKKEGAIARSLLMEDRFGRTRTGKTDCYSLFNRDYFSNPKPYKLIRFLEMIATDKDSIILDFFSGSGTTAHAVMQLNAEDGGNRKFIMVQLPEKTEESSEAFKAGYENICEIGKERIRRAGEKIKTEIEEYNKNLKIDEEPKKVPDIGFRVLKVDSSNMKDVYYSANEYTQEKIADLVSNIKEDRTDLDLLYGVMIDWNLPLSLKHKIEKIQGVTIHMVDEGSLVACFENKVSETVIREIAKLKPLRAVFRDSSFVSSPDKINVTEIFKLNSPDTSIKVI